MTILGTVLLTPMLVLFPTEVEIPFVKTPIVTSAVLFDSRHLYSH